VRANSHRLAVGGEMAKRIAFSVLAKIVLFLAYSVLVAGTSHAESIVTDCITKPNSTAPQGSHWFYRLDRVTHRQCWYLGTQRTKKPQIASPAPSLTTAPIPLPRNQLVETVAATSESTAVFSKESTKFPKSANSTVGGPSLIDQNIPVEQVTTDSHDDVPLISTAVVSTESAVEDSPSLTTRIHYILVFLGGALALTTIVFGFAFFIKSSTQDGRNKSDSGASNVRRVNKTIDPIFADVIAKAHHDKRIRRQTDAMSQAEIARVLFEDRSRALEERLRQVLHKRERKAA
jgi:hypothetical protein